jgi:hypothetical protein
MRVICAAFLVTSALSFAGIASAAEQERAAVVEDTAGQSTEVTNLRVYAAGLESRRYGLAPRSDYFLPIDTGTFVIAIPLHNLVSVAPTGKLSTVKYVFNSQEFTAKGYLGTANVSGESDFGAFHISTTKISRIDFKSPATPREGDELNGSAVPATLTLLDGSIVPVMRLHNFYRWYSTEGFIFGGEWKTGTAEGIEFMRGESKTSVAMQDIAKVDFGANDTVSVTLKNGKSATGTLAQDYVTEGFCGTFEKGYFFIDKKQIKSIEFFGGAK